MELIIALILLFVIVIAGYYGVCHVIRIWTGCDFEQASTKLHNYFNGTITYDFTNDNSFVDAVWFNVQNIIGVKQFEQLKRLSNTAIGTPLLTFTVYGGLPTINICTFCDSDTNKQRLETALTNVVKTYLNTYGYDNTILVEWKMYENLQLPYLQIRYARTKAERQLIASNLMYEQQRIVAKNSTLIDEEDEEDLDE